MTDYNGDKTTDYIDLDYQVSHWLKDDIDGLVDFLDYTALTKNW